MISYVFESIKFIKTLMCVSLYTFSNFYEYVWLGSSVVKFNGLNYADWYIQIQFQLGVFNLDLAIVMDEMPPSINKTSTV